MVQWVKAMGHNCGAGSIPVWGISTCHKYNNKKKKKNEEEKNYEIILIFSNDI